MAAARAAGAAKAEAPKQNRWAQTGYLKKMDEASQKQEVGTKCAPDSLTAPCSECPSDVPLPLHLQMTPDGPPIGPAIIQYLMQQKMYKCTVPGLPRVRENYYFR
eukprot:gene1254-7157_t